jgi:hypothetical protein
MITDRDVLIETKTAVVNLSIILRYLIMEIECYQELIMIEN